MLVQPLRYVNGISIPKETYFWDRMNSEIYFMNQEILDDEEFTITIKGDRIDSLVWSGYYDIDYKSGIIVDIIPVEEIKGIIETNVKNVYSYSIKEGVNARCTITKIELIMARVPMLNNLEEQWLVPAWNVYGSIEYDYNDGHGYTDKVSDTLLLTINALDGSLN